MSTSTTEKKAVKSLRLRFLPDDPTTGGVVSRFLRGVRAAFGGARLVFSDATLLLLSLIPMVVHVALLAGLLAIGGSVVVDPLVAWINPTGPAADTVVAEVGRAVWSGAVVVLVWLLVVGLALVGAVVLGSVICDPFYDALSERTEALHLGRDVGAPFAIATVIAGIGREFAVTMLRLVVFGAVAVPLWLLAFTPAAVVATPLSLAWTWLFFAWEFLVRSMVRHAPSGTARLRTLFDHKALFAGFGAVAWLLSFVPLTAPLLVVSATRLYLTLVADGRVPTTLPVADVERLKVRAPTA
jgi:uncharacterized protein involved in cysteine biosynthesis